MPETSFAGADGRPIHLYEWPLDNARAVVQIAHGAAEHAARYARLAEALNRAGYAVYANDHRGHGKTAEPGKLGVFAEADGWNLAVRDLERLNALIAERHPALPRALFGHSMGSLMAQQYIAEYGATIDAVVLSGSTVVDGFAELVPALEAELEANGRDAPCELMAQLMGGGFNEGIEAPQSTHDWLSRDSAEVRKYLDDPLCGFELSVGAWLDMLCHSRIPSSPEELAAIPRELPVYVFAGDHDPVSANASALEVLVERYRVAGLADLTTRFYAGGRHEMLNETNREEVTVDLITWLDARLA